MRKAIRLIANISYELLLPHVRVIMSSYKRGELLLTSLETFDHSKTIIGTNIFMISIDGRGNLKKHTDDINDLQEFNE